MIIFCLIFRILHYYNSSYYTISKYGSLPSAKSFPTKRLSNIDVFSWGDYLSQSETSQCF